MNAELTRRVDLQIGSGERVDLKASIVLGFVATAAQLLLTHSDNWLWNCLAVTAYAIAFAGGLNAMRLRTFSAVPEPSQVIRRYDQMRKEGVANTYERMLALLVGTRALAFKANWINDRGKVRSWWVSLGALGAALPLSIVSLLRSH